jgi:exosortase
VWHLAAAAAAVGAAALIASNAWEDIFHIASFDEESSHVYIVPVVFGWLLWVRRGRLRTCAPGRRGLGVVIIAAGWALWSLGYRYQFQSFWHLGAILLAVGSFVVVTGRDVFVKFMAAFAVLVFLVPVPATGRHLIAMPLQKTTAQVTQFVAEAIGMTVQRHMNLLVVNGREIEIAEACNGMRLVFTLFMACYVFAFVTPLRATIRLVVLALSPVTAILANVVRLTPTIYVFGHYPPPIAERFHDLSGWVMLIVAFLSLRAIVQVLRWATLPVAPYTLAAAG